MQRERWILLERLFAEALDLPGTARDAFLTRACAGDSNLHREIDELLRAHEASGVLDSALHSVEPVAAQPPSLPAGTCLGPWRIHDLIGRGGMGEVYEASRADGAFEQRVALKLLRYEAVAELQRFNAERRILARLEHPGIARLLDGGTTPDGRPFTVMEFVEGRSLTDYCREHQLSLPQRLGLFAQVCDAVAFAHRNLIIHRDLKPDNILVDAHGAVKLLDFGIAKLLDIAVLSRDADVTIAPFTPDYAAPEQLTGEPVTTATDIYALGVVLFELLTGERPLRTRDLPSAQALKLLMDRSAPPPSRVARDNVNAPVAARSLTGDLDAIVAKCLRKEASHRYETVDALKRDVERHLREEPVLAREGARLYVLGRLLRRYRWAVAGMAALIVTLVAGLAGTAWQARRAELQAARATAVLGFVEGLFEGADPAVTKGAAITARELLDHGAQRVDAEFAQQVELRAQLKHTIGRLYLKLGLLDRAEQELSAALALTPANGEDDARFWRLLDRARVDLAVGAADAGLARLDEASALTTHWSARANAGIALAGLRAQLWHQRGDDAKALDAAAQAHAQATRALGSDHAETLDAAEAYAELLSDAARYREALPLLDNAAAMREETLGKDDPRTLHAKWLLAGVLRNVDEVPRATALAQDVLERDRRVLGEEHPDTAKSWSQVGALLYAAGRYSDADAPLAQAIALLRRLEPTDRNLLALTLYNKATNAYFQGRLDEAEQGYRESSALWTALYGPDHRDALTAEMALAQVLRRQGSEDEAISLLRHVLDRRTAVGGDTPERVEALRILGDALNTKGELRESIEDLEAAEQMSLRLYGEKHEMPQQTRALLGSAYLNAGEAQKAAEVTTRALDALQKLHPDGHPDVARTQGTLARIELRLGEVERAEQLSRLQYDFVRAQFPEPDNARVAESQGLFGECLLANGHPEAGREALQNAIAVLTMKQPRNPDLGRWRQLLSTPR
ncbi:MAG: protein kinase domain-containing protein [Rhodanobacteraceae bacterium]